MLHLQSLWCFPWGPGRMVSKGALAARCDRDLLGLRNVCLPGCLQARAPQSYLRSSVANSFQNMSLLEQHCLPHQGSYRCALDCACTNIVTYDWLKHVSGKGERHGGQRGERQANIHVFSSTGHIGREVTCLCSCRLEDHGTCCLSTGDAACNLLFC